MTKKQNLDKDKLRILLWSACPWTKVGYGTQAKGIAEAMLDLGHEVAFQSLFGLLGASINWKGVPIYPARNHPLGWDVVESNARHFGADLIVSFYDIWALPLDICGTIKTPWAAMTPVDGTPVQEVTVLRLQQVTYPVAFARDSLKLMQEAELNDATYIPLGIDCNVFKPSSKQAARDALDIPQDCYLMTMIAANKGFPCRKSFPEVLQAFARFRTCHPEAILYLHSTRKPFGSSGNGIYFDAIIDDLEIPRSSVAFAPENELVVGVPDEQMAQIYQASDVLLSPSMGEGFGLPIAEAQACGCPVITQDCSAMSELTINGIACKPLTRWWQPGLNYWWQLADVNAIRDAMERLYCQPADVAQENARQGAEYIKNVYSWDVVRDMYWKPFLERVREELW